MNKKRFVKWTAVACVLFLLSGCMGNIAGDQKTQIAVYVLADNPIDDWDPSTASRSGAVILHNIYQTLLTYDPVSNEFANVLSTGYSVSEDGLVWDFSLRDEVVFHDGTEFNADAVKYSVERTMRLGRGAAYIWDPVKSIEAVDRLTVRFTLNYVAPLERIVSSNFGAFIFSPSAAEAGGDEWFAEGNEAGTGAYTLSSFQKGSSALLVGFSKYWEGWKATHVSQIVVKKVEGESRRLQMVKDGEASVALDIRSGLYENQSGVSESVFPGALILSLSRESVSDVSLRKALFYAFPYDYARELSPSQDSAYVPFFGAYDTDIDRAQKYYDGASDKKTRLSLSYPQGNKTLEDICKKYGENLKNLGITLELRELPWESIVRTSQEKESSDMFIYTYHPDYSESFAPLYGLYREQETGSFPGFVNEELSDAASMFVRFLFSDAKKASEYDLLTNEILVDSAAHAFCAFGDTALVSPYLHGYSANQAYPGVIFFHKTFFSAKPVITG